MTPPYVQDLRILNYGCIRDVTLRLSPLHALVGPNDSGKSTILRALRVAMQLAGGVLMPAPFETLMPVTATPPIRISVGYPDGLAFNLTHGDETSEAVTAGDKMIAELPSRAWNLRSVLYRSPPQSGLSALRERMMTATMLRFDPNMLRAAAPLLNRSEPIRFHHETGFGLASVLNAINTRDVDAFVSLRDRAKRLFPSIRSLRTPTTEGEQGGEKRTLALVEADLATGEVGIGGAALSEGLLYYVAFEAARSIEATSVFLVEEPENGLHPARIKEVVAVLREISTTNAQVLLATHSPLVINELAGDEVSIITRTPAEGTKAVLLRDTKNYAERQRVMANGEIWLSYGNGEDEHDLIEGPEPAA